MLQRRLKDRLWIGAVIISIVVALASMLAVSVVIRLQHLDQSNAVLSKASRVVDDNLTDRKNSLLSASRQLATQRNLGSTLWYLAQYAQSGLDHETLENTYQQLLGDTYKIGRVARLSQLAIYDVTGNLVAFAQSRGVSDLVGFVIGTAAPTLMVASPREGEELNRQALHESKAAQGIEFHFKGPLPQQESAHLTVSQEKLAIESFVPVMGVAFNPDTGKQEIKQLGLVAALQFLDEAFVEHISRLTDVKINVFTPRGLSSGSLANYRTPDWGDSLEASGPLSPRLVFNETYIDGTGYYQCLSPFYAEKQFVGSIAFLQSKEVVRKNTLQMVSILGVIALACLLIILPLGWYFAISIAHPLTVLSRIFRGIASGEQDGAFRAELAQLEGQPQRYQEMRDLTQSFVAMDQAITQKMQQINEINASLEEVVAQRTAELRIANDELTKRVSHDPLTGLPNRKLLSDRVQMALAVARRNETPLALMYIDLDEFKPINDTLGHDFGDLLLKKAALRIQSSLREADTVARVGGDEFIVLLPIIQTSGDAVAVAEKIRQTMCFPFDLAGHECHISSSIGIAIFPDHGSNETVLFKNADTAMYLAKNGGRNRTELFQNPPLSD